MPNVTTVISIILLIVIFRCVGFLLWNWKSWFFVHFFLLNLQPPGVFTLLIGHKGQDIDSFSYRDLQTRTCPWFYHRTWSLTGPPPCPASLLVACCTILCHLNQFTADKVWFTFVEIKVDLICWLIVKFLFLTPIRSVCSWGKKFTWNIWTFLNVLEELLQSNSELSRHKETFWWYKHGKEILTFPIASVQFDSHANRLWVRAVGKKTDPPSNYGRINLS